MYESLITQIIKNMAYKTIIANIRKHSPVIMGIVNATPDSFSNDGVYSKPTQAVQYAMQIHNSGAMIVDIGGESTRPGAQSVTLLEELRRVTPIIKGIVKIKSQLIISIDTHKPEVAATALRLGANMVNDISGLHDPLMRKVVAREHCPVVLMHKQGTPGNMQKQPRYKDVVNDIIIYFKRQISQAKKDGIAVESIMLDPGIGFGKTVHHNLEILQRLPEFKKAFPGHLLLIGASRKSFIGKFTNTENPTDRLSGTLAVHQWAVSHGADIIRVHDVAEHVQMLAIHAQLS